MPCYYGQHELVTQKAVAPAKLGLFLFIVLHYSPIPETLDNVNFDNFCLFQIY